MKSVVSFVLVFLFGGTIGWWANGLIPPEKGANDVVEPLVEKHVADQAVLLKPETTPQATLSLNADLLSHPQFSELIELFKNGMSVLEKEALDEKLVQYATNLNQGRRMSVGLEAQLLALVGVASIQTRVLPILIAYYEKTGQNQRAIAQLFELKSLLSFDADFKAATQKILALTNKEVKRLKQANQKKELTKFYEYRLFIEPDNYALQMQFALFEYENRHYDNTLQLLSVLVYHPELEEQALKLFQRAQRQLDLEEIQDSLIGLDKRGDQYLVTAMINDQESVTLMLDTGASMTILSPAIMDSLGITEEDEAQQIIRFSTANGEVNAPVVRIDKMSIQQYSVTDISIGVLPAFPMGNVDGLLGMDFLGQFIFFIDPENATLQLTRTDKP